MNVKKYKTSRFRKYLLIVIFTFFIPFISCKKFLNVNGLESLSGNNFWASEDDVESYTVGVYSYLRTALLSNLLNPIMGDFRCAYWQRYTGQGVRYFVDYASINDPLDILNLKNIGTDDDIWGIATMIDVAWTNLYKMVASANILYQQVDVVTDSKFSDADRKKYKAEAVFLRSLAYFYLCRMFGDVPYYTEAYNSEAIAKTSQITIFNNLIHDLGEVADDLPWTYDDPANNAVRAMKGGALILMMEMNMWNAGFDLTNDKKYWSATDSLGKELIENNGGAYSLLPIDDYPEIFRGKSSEGLVEVSRNANYGEVNYSLDLVGYVLKNPPITGTTRNYSYIYPQGSYLSKIFPADQADSRKDLWFPTGLDLSSITASNFEFYKYFDKSQASNGYYPRGSLMVFRYPDAYLLRAEALNDLGDDDEAIQLLNIVRERANASDYIAGTQDLSVSDAIWYERCREFIGEASYFFDLVRTRRVLDSRYAPHIISLEDFNAGSWTWPMPDDAYKNNPYLSHGYWN